MNTNRSVERSNSNVRKNQQHMNSRKPDETRGGIAFGFLIILGLAIGFMIKRVHYGLVIGLALGLLASGFLRKR